MDINKFLKKPYAEIYLDLPYITLDIETTNISYGDSTIDENDMVLTVMKDSRYDYTVVRWGGHMDMNSAVIDYLQDKDHFLVGQNIKFDLRWLAKAGLDLSKVLVWDTMIAEKVLLGNNPKNLPLDLGSIAERYGLKGKEPVVDKMIKMGVCPSVIPQSLLERRCEYDVQTTERIFLRQLEKIVATGKLGVVLTRCLLTPVLADIESNGLYLDKDRVHEEWNRAKQEFDVVSRELASIQDINWNSTKQKGEALYDWYKFKELKRYGKPLRTAKDKRKTDIATIYQLKATTKIQKRVKGLLLQQSKINAQLTKALDKMKACVDNDDILYAQFNQHIATTHRLTSTGANYSTQIQNLARIFKRLFTCRKKGWLYCEADGANLEFRVAIELADDAQGREDIDNPDFDAHMNTANEMEARGQPTTRQEAKAHTFKPLYGGSSGTDAERAYYDWFKTRYSGIATMQEGWKDEAMLNKSVKLPWGMEFFFPATKYAQSGYQTFSTQICNYPVQSFATADIIPIAMVYVWHDMKTAHMDAMMVNTVHDSVEIEAPPSEVRKLNEILITNFTYSCYNYLMEVYNFNFKTPLGVGIKWGTHWGEGEENVHTVANPNI